MYVSGMNEHLEEQNTMSKPIYSHSFKEIYKQIIVLYSSIPTLIQTLCMVYTV